MKKTILAMLMTGLLLSSKAQLTSVSNFGSNPGNLSMYKYTPSNMPAGAPLVLVLHGCTQNASTYATQSDWNSLANEYKFYVIYAEQKSSNNSSECFNWFESGDITRGYGEAASLKNMTDYMKSNHSINSSKVFVTGFSAGAAMTTVMLATYPEVFKAGAVMAGLPYKVATNSNAAFQAMFGNTNKSPNELGNNVRNASNYSGPWPTVGVFHGTSDYTVYYMNQNEVMEQWTNVHGVDQTADLTVNNFMGNSVVNKKEYHNGAGTPIVVTYSFNGMGHAIAVDPGSGTTQGGNTGSYATDINFFSSYWAADFFGITNTSTTPLPAPTNLSATAVSSSQINLTWTDNATTETAYLVKRSTSSGGPYSTIATLSANSTSYSNTGLSAATTYYYKVTGQDGAGTTATSTVASATTQSGGSSNPPNAPSGMSVTSTTATSISLSWTDQSTNESNFVLQRSTNGTSYATIATLAANTTSYTNTGLSNSTTYYYRVKATNSHGSSGYSTTSGTTSGAQTIVKIEQLTGNGIFTYGNAHNMGQSFTAIANGNIVSVEANLVYAISGTTLKIFAGNGVSGTPIYSQSGISKGSGWQTITLSTPLAVSNNQMYTFQLTNASIRYTYSSVYSGGNLWYDNISYSTFDCGFVVSISTSGSSREAGLLTNPEVNALAIYPNPASHAILINNLIDASQLSIYSLSGKLVLTKKVTSIDNRVDIQHLQTGLYHLVLQCDGYKISQQVVKE